jgi:hypothetical protein
MPRISRGDRLLSEVLVYLSLDETRELQEALKSRLDEREGFRGPAWHCQIEDDEGNELTVGVLDE